MQTNTPSDLLYTNEASPEYLRTLDNSHFTEEQVATFHPHAADVVRQGKAFAALHPTIAIYRVAAEGSETRKGGVIRKTHSPLTFTLDDDRVVRAAHKGDYAEYPDGSTAQIITGAGESNSNLALVGSRLSNGDKIINTPQAVYMLVASKDDPMPEDFLPPCDG
jgi:hypothetical protein